ncbi:MAG: polysaccharide deacetylase family protein [Rhodospirillaceae bacterium]|nr:polysaccharide deacetylase family protein [Rhodospirillaceae bacterium]MBT6086191.1 polysaccharide deacetylase family protein [Rhodospirillaceae bacterium]
MYAVTDQPHGIMFHHFHGEGYAPSQGSISSDDLHRLLDYIGVDKILPADEFERRAISKQLAPADLCLTFDDCLRCQFDIALPILESAGLTAFWFLHTAVFDGNPELTEIYREFRHHYFRSIDDFYDAFETALHSSPYAAEAAAKLVGFEPDEYLKGFSFYSTRDRWFHYVRDQVLRRERYTTFMDQMIVDHGMDVDQYLGEIWMDPAQIKHLHQRGHVVGLHSHTHPTRLAHLPAEEQKLEYHKNAEWLRQISGSNAQSMSHPCNSYDGNTLNILETMGVKIGFRSNMADLESRTDLEFPRQDHANLMRQIGAR